MVRPRRKKPVQTRKYLHVPHPCRGERSLPLCHCPRGQPIGPGDPRRASSAPSTSAGAPPCCPPGRPSMRAAS
eukprot:1391897-Prymnesium_polylepis.1